MARTDTFRVRLTFNWNYVLITPERFTKDGANEAALYIAKRVGGGVTVEVIDELVVEVMEGRANV